MTKYAIESYLLSHQVADPFSAEIEIQHLAADGTVVTLEAASLADEMTCSVQH